MDRIGRPELGSGKFHILFLFFVSVMFCISVSSLFWYHVYLVLHNRSTLEQFRAPYYANGPDENGWSLGRRNNFQEVFGKRALYWFLPITTSIGKYFFMICYLDFFINENLIYKPILSFNWLFFSINRRWINISNKNHYFKY